MVIINKDRITRFLQCLVLTTLILTIFASIGQAQSVSVENRIDYIL